MATTALQAAVDAYKDAQVGQDLESFQMAEFPYDIALSVTNSAISALNRLGNYSFAETSMVLPYTAGSTIYDLNTVGSEAIEPRRIIRLRRGLLTAAGELRQMNFRDFENRFRNNAIPTQRPVAWAKYGNELHLNSIPDQDYQIKLYYYAQIQPIVIGVNDNQPTIVPEYHIDILKDMINAMLLKEMQRPDFANQFALASKKAAQLIARSNEDAGLPTNMPRAF